MTKKKIGVLFGMEDSFPWALINEINGRNHADVEAEPVRVSYLKDYGTYGYDLIVDRISHEVPFYRTFMKCAMATGAQIINNPVWWAADDKFFDILVAKAIDVAVPKSVLVPHKQHPPNTQATSFRNMALVEWDELFGYLGFPIFLKPAYGGGWKDVYKCDTPQEFFEAYDKTRDLCMMAQEAIDFTEYYRCYVLGRSRVHIMRYDPKQPFHKRYVLDAPDTDKALYDKMHQQCLDICEALGYDMNTVEFAVRDGIPYAIDYMNCAPDADINSVGEENFRWVIDNMADVLIERVRNPRPMEMTGNWPSKVHKLVPAVASAVTSAPAATTTPAAKAPAAATAPPAAAPAVVEPAADKRPRTTTSERTAAAPKKPAPRAVAKPEVKRPRKPSSGE